MNELRKSQTFARPGEIPSKARFARSLALFAHWRQLRGSSRPRRGSLDPVAMKPYLSILITGRQPR